MKVVIFAGGLGTRLAEETDCKPMVRIGEKPILWHIMKYYQSFGFNDFVLLVGHKAVSIAEYFANSEFNIEYAYDLPGTRTGGALKNASKYVHETFMCAYGDGLGNIDLDLLIQTHKKNKTMVTLTATQIDGKFGALEIRDGLVKNFWEKPKKVSWISAGFYVMEPEIFDKIDKNKTVLESDVLAKLAKKDKISAYKHKGYWQPMDTLRDKRILEEQWNKGAPWKVWQ